MCSINGGLSTDRFGWSGAASGADESSDDAEDGEEADEEGGTLQSPSSASFSLFRFPVDFRIMWKRAAGDGDRSGRSGPIVRAGAEVVARRRRAGVGRAGVTGAAGTSARDASTGRPFETDSQRRERDDRFGYGPSHGSMLKTLSEEHTIKARLWTNAAG